MAFKLSVVLEALTSAFNSNVKEAATTFAKAENDMKTAATAGSSAATAAASTQEAALASVSRAAAAAGSSQVASAKEATAATTASAAAAAEAAKTTNAANASVKPPGSFASFFAAIKQGWKEGVAEGIAASTGMATAADGAAAHVNALGKQITGVAPTARTAGREIADALNVKSLSTSQFTKLKDAINSLDPTAKKVETEVEAALALRNLSPAQLDKLKKSMGDLGPAAEKSGKDVEKGLTLGGLVKSVGAIVTVREAIKQLIDNAVQLQQITNQLTFATGGVAQGAAAYAFLRDTANSLGLSLESSAKGFAALSVSTKGTQLEGKATRDLFLGVAQAAATMGLSVADTEGVFNALSQIASKGTVQMEELRGQLGDRLPGVLKVAADSMGVTVAELNNLVANGLDATQFLKNFGPALQAAFSAQAAENLKTLGGQMAVLKNQFFELLSTINTAGAGSALTVIVHDVGEALKELGQLFRSASSSPDFAAVNEVLIGTYTTIKDDIGQIIATATSLFDVLDTTFKAITGIAATIEGGDLDGHQLGLLETALAGVNISLGLIGDGFKAIEIALDATAGEVQSAFGIMALTAGRLAGVLNKDLGQSLTDLGDKLLAGAEKSFAKAEQGALSFTSGAAKAFQNLAAAADKANATLDPSKQLDAAQKALTAYLQVAKSGAQPVLVIQDQADTLAKSFKSLYDKGAISAGALRTALDSITNAIPPANVATQDFLSSIIKLGSNKAANFSALSENAKEVGATLKGDLTEGVAEALVAFAKLGDSASTSSRNVRLSFTNLINQAQTKADIDAVTQALIAMSARGKITGTDVSEAFREIADQALKLKTVLPQSYNDALSAIGAKTNEELSNDTALAERYTARVQELYDAKVVGLGTLNDAMINSANVAAAAAQKALTFAGAVTATQLAAQLQAAKGYVDQLVEEYKRGEVGIQAVLDAQAKYLDLSQSGIQKALDAVGGKTNAQLAQAVVQAKANLDLLTEAAGRNEVSYTLVAKAQVEYSNAIAATIPGAATLADVQARLTKLNQDSSEAIRENAAASAARSIQQAQESRTRRENSQLETEEGAALNAQFNDSKNELLALSAAAANEFGRLIGVQFGYMEAGADAANSSIDQLRQQLGALQNQTFTGVDFIGISTKMKELGIDAAKVKLEFAEQKQQVTDSANRIDDLANSGTASLAELQKATRLSGATFGVLGKADLTGLNSALDAAKQRIQAIEDASKSTTEALKNMGDSFQVQILRSQGKEVEAIQLEAKQQADDIDKQIAALGGNASPEAVAAANRAKNLLDQVTAEKIATQKAQDAADKAQKAVDPTGLDPTETIQVPALPPKQTQPPVQATPPQAVPPAPTTPTAPSSDGATPSGGSQTVILKFEDASGKSTSVTAASPQVADDLLATLKRAGATNITKQGG